MSKIRGETRAAVSTQQTSQDNPLADFGPNEWIVEDMYQRYLADPSSVDPAWHDFFADYKPSPADGGPPAPEAKAAPKAEPKPTPKAEVKAEPKAEPNAEPKPEPKAKPKAA